MKSLNPIDYRKFFSSIPLTCLNSECIMRGSLGKANVLLINTKKDFNSFYNLEAEKDCHKAGIDLFSNKEKYTQYFNEFKKYIELVQKYILPKYKNIPSSITKEEFIKDLSIIGKLWHYYGFLESPHIEPAFEHVKKENNKDAIANLNYLAEFKFEARKIMNAYFFKGGVFENILTYISKKFSVDAKYLFIDEIISLFEDKNVKKELIEQRKICYSARIENKKLIKHSHKDSLKLYKKFVKTEDTNFVKGVIANKGLSKGRVVICPLLDDYESIGRINSIMKKGDILIAETTSPDVMILCEKASAIVAEQGGILSHASIVSRELNIPCIIQAVNSTKIFKNGDLVEVDANKGIIRKILFSGNPKN